MCQGHRLCIRLIPPSALESALPGMRHTVSLHNRERRQERGSTKLHTCRPYM